MAAVQEDDEYEIPLRDQRYFGAGIKRKRVKFVSSTSNEAAVQSLPTTPSQSAADKYLSIVFNKAVPDERSASAPPSESTSGATGNEQDDPQITIAIARSEDVVTTCDICQRPITAAYSARKHESSIAHQICLQHSHPPSNIDRRRKGLAVLENQGWDVDSREGLGAEGEGILYPIKAKENPQRAGLGADFTRRAVKVEKAPKLDAGKVRMKEKEGKKKAERLRNAFYRSDDVEKYLGGGGEMNTNLDMAAFKSAKRSLPLELDAADEGPYDDELEQCDAGEVSRREEEEDEVKTPTNYADTV
ncbi:hypothetical protein LTR37_018411 [Vermiconidia calcicola]|uniref:Uncharacterized protein n=1 Tax=Vermiconidia calcicola TaxID=1690605 RepID=A0ACC3MH35_9PEZI|nr:hypothetical protein LTR37_018411 [Vermiconidia calcicola]